MRCTRQHEGHGEGRDQAGPPRRRKHPCVRPGRRGLHRSLRAHLLVAVESQDGFVHDDLLTVVRLAHIGRAHLVVPFPVIAEWWRGRTDLREAMLAATRIVASLEAAKAAGVALARLKDVDAKLTVLST